jgi:hypothetical protein
MVGGPATTATATRSHHRGFLRDGEGRGDQGAESHQNGEADDADPLPHALARQLTAAV